jgi:hypothetical protein
MDSDYPFGIFKLILLYYGIPWPSALINISVIELTLYYTHDSFCMTKINYTICNVLDGNVLYNNTVRPVMWFYDNYFTYFVPVLL